MLLCVRMYVDRCVCVLLQVIVVVTEDWGVLCFDTALRLLWETKANHLEDRYSGAVMHLKHRCAALPCLCMSICVSLLLLTAIMCTVFIFIFVRVSRLRVSV